MKLKGRSILVITLLIFGGYAVYDFMQDKKKETLTMEQSRLMTVDFDQVDQVVLEKPTAKIVLKRSVNGWSLESPLKDNADSGMVDDYLKGMATEKIIEIVKDEPGINWATYGLDKPMGTLTLTSTSGAKNTFEISEKRNFEENAYARRNGEERVLLVNSVWQNRLRKEVIDFRDRRVLRHRMASIDSFKLKNQSGTMELSLKDGKWVSSRSPVDLDQNKVRELLQGIADAKASEFVDQLPALKPLFTLDLKLADLNWKAEVGQAKDFKIYAKVSEPAFNLKLESGAMDKLIKLSTEDLKVAPRSKENKAKDPAQEDQAMLAGGGKIGQLPVTEKGSAPVKSEQGHTKKDQK